jgi:hypothetical protein
MEQMIPGRVHGHVIPAMKRLYLLILLLFVVPLAFFGGVYFNQKKGYDNAGLIKSSHAEEVRELRQTIYGSNRFHSSNYSPDLSEQLSAFDPRSAECFLRLSYERSKEYSLELRGDGTLLSIVDGKIRRVATLGEEETKEVFLRVISSGLLNYSDDVVKLKRELTVVPAMDGYPNCTVFVISVPQLNAEKTIRIDYLETEARTFPDIVEYRLMLDSKKTMTDLVPAGVNYWE